MQNWVTTMKEDTEMIEDGVKVFDKQMTTMTTDSTVMTDEVIDMIKVIVVVEMPTVK